MRTFVNCLKFKIAPILFSVLLALSLPLTSLRSEAAALGITASEFFASLYSLFLMGHLTSDVVDDTIFGSDYVTSEDISAAFSIFDEANAYRDGLGDELKSAVISGAISGTLILDEDLRKDYYEYLDSLDLASGDSLSVGVYDQEFELQPADSVYTITVSYHKNSDFTFYQDVFTITSSVPYFVYAYNYNSTVYPFYFAFPSQSGSLVVSTSTNNTSAVFTMENHSWGYTTSDGTSFSNNAAQLYVSNSSTYTIDGVSMGGVNYAPDLSSLVSSSELADLLYGIKQNGVASINSFLTVSEASADTDILSNTNTISEDGSVSGLTSLSLPSIDYLNTVLGNLAEGIISFDDALAAIGLGSVSSSATASEKDSVLNDVKSLSPTVTLDYGATSVDEATEAFSGVQTQEQTLTEEVEEKIRQGYDEDSSGKVDWWPQWSFPDYVDGSPGGLITDPDPDPSDTARITEIVSATGVIGGLLSDFFNASGGASGFGLIYIVGISFVLFSVLIGASHFLGALGGNDVRSSSRSSHSSVQRNSSVGKHERSHG